MNSVASLFLQGHFRCHLISAFGTAFTVCSLVPINYLFALFLQPTARAPFPKANSSTYSKLTELSPEPGRRKWHGQEGRES